jgi:hypothetical protein
LQIDYNIPSHSFANLNESSTFGYNSDQQLAATEMPSDQRSHRPCNHQHCQAKQLQNNTLNYASQFPHILSALRGDYTIATDVSSDTEYAIGDPSVAETASANVYWRKNQAQPCFAQPQYEPISPPVLSDNDCDKKYTFPPDAYFNELQLSSSGLHSQNEMQMSALATRSVEPVKEQGSQFLEMQGMEPVYQEALKIGQNENPPLAEKSQICTDITTQISLLDLQDPMEELFPLSLQDSVNEGPCTTTLWSPQSFNFSGVIQGENTSTTFPKRYFQFQ